MRSTPHQSVATARLVSASAGIHFVQYIYFGNTGNIGNDSSFTALGCSATALPIPDRAGNAGTIRPRSACALSLSCDCPQYTCVYCFARATHAFLGMGPGDDFEHEIFVKVNAPALLRQELQRPSIRGEPLVFGTVSDPYQPAEARYRLTRQLLTVAGEAGNPVAVTTKSSLITRDVPLLSALAESPGCAVNITITTLDAAIARRLEPRTPNPAMRLETVARLADAGIPVGVLLAPVMPGITDRPGEIEQLVAAVAARGASYLIADPLRIDDGFAAPLLAAIARDFPAQRRIYERQAATGHLSTGTANRLAARVDEARRRFGLAATVPDLRRPRPEQLGLPLAG